MIARRDSLQAESKSAVSAQLSSSLSSSRSSQPSTRRIKEGRPSRSQVSWTDRDTEQVRERENVEVIPNSARFDGEKEMEPIITAQLL